MVILTMTESKHVLDVLEIMAETDERYEEGLTMAIEIMEESLRQPQEIEIPDGRDSKVSPERDKDTRVV